MNIWKNSSKVELIKFDVSQLIIELDSNIRRIEKSLRNRDLRETVVAYIMIPFFAYLAYEIPFIVSKVGALIIVVYCINVIIKFKKINQKKRPVDASLSFKEQLVNQKQNLLDQIHLYKTILYWYILPPVLGNVLFVLGLGSSADHDWSNRFLNGYLTWHLSSKITFLLIVILFGGFIYWLNQRVVTKTLQPIVDKIDRIQEQMDTI